MILTFFSFDGTDIKSDTFKNIKKGIIDIIKSLKDYKNALNGAKFSLSDFITHMLQSKIEANGTSKAIDILNLKMFALQAATVALNAAIGIGVGWLISKGVSAYQEWQNKVENTAQSAKEAASAARETTASLKDLVDAYKELGDRSEWNSSDFEHAKDIQDQLLTLAKEQNSLDQDRVDALDLQNGKYKDQLDLLDKITMKQLEAASYDLTTSKDAQGEKLVRTGKDQRNSHLLTILNSNEMAMADSIRDSGVDIENSLGGFGADNWNDPDSIVAYYNNIGDALKYVIDNTTEAERKAGGAYHNLYQFLIDEQNALKDDVGNYNDSTDAIKDNANARAKLAAVILMGGQKDSENGSYSDYEKINSALETLKSTINGFDSTKLNDLLWSDNEGLTNEQVNALTVLRKAITDMDFSADADGVNTFIQALVQLEMVSLNAADGLTGLQQVAKDMEEISKELDNLQSAYNSCASAVEEYNKYGYMSVDSLQSLLSMDTQYLSCLDLVDEKLQINKQRYAELLVAQYAQAEVTAIQQATEELKAIQDEATREKIEGLTTATENEQTALENVIPAIKDTTVATGDLAVALAAAQGAVGDDEALNAKIEAVTSALNTKLAAIHASTQAAINSGTALANQLSGFDTSSKKAGSSASKSVTDVTSAFDTLNKAMKEYNQYGYICADTMRSLVGLDDKFTSCLTEQNSKLKINTDTFRTFIKAQLEEADAAEDGGKSATEMQRILDWLNSSIDSETISFEQLIEALKGYGSAMDEAREAADRFAGSIEKIYGLNTNANSKGLFDKSAIDNFLDATKDLKDLGTYASYKDGEFQINYEELKKKVLEQIEAQIAAAEASGNTLQTEVLNRVYKDISSGAQSALEYITGIGSELERITDKMDDFQSSYNDLKDITKEYNTYGVLSQDSIQKIMAMSPEYLACLDLEGKQLQFNAEKFKELYKSKLLEYAKTLEAAGGNQELADQLKRTADAADNLDIHFNGAKDTINEFIDAISDLKDVLGSVIDLFGKGFESESNSLKIWGEAITDEIDSRIDELNKQKEALQEKNDEEERAIELAKLKDALARARNQKTVRRYVEGQGYIWTVDEDAVSEAEQNLNDQLREWRKEDEEKAIDDQIKSLEELKDKYGEVIDLIGQDWDDYQETLKAQAAAQQMSLDKMAASLSEYRKSVESNMQAIRAQTVITYTIDNLSDLYNSLVKVYNAIYTINNLVSGLTGSSGGITGWITGFIKDKLNIDLSSLFTGGESAAGSGDGIKAIVDTVSTGLKDAGTGFIDVVKSGLGIGGTATVAGEGVAAGTAVAAGGLSLSTLGVYGLVGAGIGGLVNWISSFWKRKAEEEEEKLLNSRVSEFESSTSDTTSKTNSTIRALLKSSGLAEDKIDEIVALVNEGFNEVVEGAMQMVADLRSYYEEKETKEEQEKTVKAVVGGAAGAAAGAAIGSMIAPGVGTVIGGLIGGLAGGIFGSWATGTESVDKSGFYNVDEKGTELIVRKPAAGRYTYLEANDGVVPADITSKLFELGANPDKYFEEQLSKHRGNDITVRNDRSTTITIGDVIVQKPVGNADQLAHDIVNRLPNHILQDLSKR